MIDDPLQLRNGCHSVVEEDEYSHQHELKPGKEFIKIQPVIINFEQIFFLLKPLSTKDNNYKNTIFLKL